MIPGFVDAVFSAFWLQILLFVVLLAISGLFSGSEVAFLTLHRVRRRQLEEEGAKGIRHVNALLAHPQRFLVTILLVNNLVNVAAAALATSIAIDLIGHRGVAVATGVVTLLLLTFGEITPKAYATLNNERFALRLAPFIRAVQQGLYPVVRAFEAFTMWMLKRFGSKEDTFTARQFGSEDELLTLITMGAEEGVIEEAEEEMLHSIIALGDTLAKEVMVPRIDIVGVPATATLNEVRARVLDSGYSRIPVYEETMDDVVGILYVRDMLTRIVKGSGNAPVRAVMREAFYVPATKRVADLLAEMRENHVHVAVVLDEFGGTAGIVTLEDIIEEIVGEIFDEYDLRQDAVRALDASTAIVDARTSVEDVSEALGIAIPEDASYETLGGFINHHLGHLGREGDVVDLEGTRFIVDRGTHRRVLRVRVVKTSSGDEGGDTGGSEGAGDQAGSGNRP